MSPARIAKISALIDYIELHLTEPLDLTCIAHALHHSPYHLHRLFTQTVGLTPHDYIRRRRLTEAAKLLVFTDRSILDISALAGYQSQQAFTHIFTALYKRSPRQYRAAEAFYPLQLRFSLAGDYPTLRAKQPPDWEITFAAEADIPAWMELVRLVIDGFPHLEEQTYLPELLRRIQSRQALLLKDGGAVVGALLFSRENGSLDFLGVHPLYRSQGVPQALLEAVKAELPPGRTISITTYRAGDQADTGHRRAIQALGFSEAELLIEFGYPTQRFILPREATTDAKPASRRMRNRTRP